MICRKCLTYFDVFVDDLLGAGVDEADLDAGGANVYSHDVGCHFLCLGGLQ